MILSLNVLSYIFLFKCNHNMFGQFFNFNNSLNFEEFCIPTSLCFLHQILFYVLLMFVLHVHMVVYFFTTNVCIYSSDYQLILIFSTCDFMISGSKPKEGTDLKSPIKDVLKSHFLVLMKRKLKMLLKVMEDSIIMLNSSEKSI
jgi:hypothetical protein